MGGCISNNNNTLENNANSITPKLKHDNYIVEANNNNISNGTIINNSLLNINNSGSNNGSTNIINNNIKNNSLIDINKLPNTPDGSKDKLKKEKVELLSKKSSSKNDISDIDEEVSIIRTIDPTNLEIILRATYVHRGGKSCLINHAVVLSESLDSKKFINANLVSVAQTLNLTLRRLAHFAWDLIELEDPIILRSMKFPKEKELSLYELKLLLERLKLSVALREEWMNPLSILQEQPTFLRHFWNRASDIISKENTSINDIEDKENQNLAHNDNKIRDLSESRREFSMMDLRKGHTPAFSPLTPSADKNGVLKLIDASKVTVDDVLAVRMRTIGIKYLDLKWKNPKLPQSIFDRVDDKKENDNKVNLKFVEMGLARYSRVREPDLLTDTTSHMMFCIDIASFLCQLFDSAPPLTDKVSSLPMPSVNTMASSPPKVSEIQLSAEKNSIGKISVDGATSIASLTSKSLEILRSFNRVIQSNSYRFIRCGIIFTNCDSFSQLLRSKLKCPFLDLIQSTSDDNIIDAFESEINVKEMAARKDTDAVSYSNNNSHLRRKPQISLKRNNTAAIEDDTRHIWHFCGYNATDPHNSLDALRFIASIFAYAHNYVSEQGHGHHRYPLSVYAADLHNDASVKMLMDNLTSNSTPQAILENPRNIKWWDGIENFPNVTESIFDVHLAKISNPLNKRAALLALCPIEHSIASIIANRDTYHFNQFPSQIRKIYRLLFDAVLKRPNGNSYYPNSKIVTLPQSGLLSILTFLSPYA